MLRFIRNQRKANESTNELELSTERQATMNGWWGFGDILSFLLMERQTLTSSFRKKSGNVPYNLFART